MKKTTKTQLTNFLKQTPSPKLMLIVTAGLILALLIYITILLLSMR
ncbi:MAG: hypothetical protein UR96_C0019G0006 [candidate division WS6 bacterium GW2011_GWC1_36_11]|uniref:Uncharacterized protein n=2 Tax=Candidatus Dojkabacteria TaxID=74243 RepID=A0A0G0GKS6_9BACT|nr:MAG: hypothetical protein UR96_C0019G0006 [candidate division WS6 bacterium GW2011_GWC1_36_11]KKQ10830.1 MAG: hypothetical protein US24_C0054G0008 [candidate division WS6 bacterium GW2011_GWC2_36_7]